MRVAKTAAVSARASWRSTCDVRSFRDATRQVGRFDGFDELALRVTYERAADGSFPGPTYSRDGNPTYRQLEALRSVTRDSPSLSAVVIDQRVHSPGL